MLAVAHARGHDHRRGRVVRRRDRCAGDRARRPGGPAARSRSGLSRREPRSPRTSSTGPVTRCAVTTGADAPRPPRTPALLVSARTGRRRIVGGQHLHRAARPARATTTSGPRSAFPTGAGTRASPRSSGSRTTSTSATNGTRRTARSRSGGIRASELVPWQAGFLDACAALGFPRGDDANDPTTTGWGPHAMNKVGGERMSVARCYLTPTVRARPGLRIEARSIVRRVLFSGRQVAGVEVETQGRVHAIESRRVVLCAGRDGHAGDPPALRDRSAVVGRAARGRRRDGSSRRGGAAARPPRRGDVPAAEAGAAPVAPRPPHPDRAALHVEGKRAEKRHASSSPDRSCRFRF